MAMHRQTLLDQIPGIRDLYEAVPAPDVQAGHANTLGLNRYGVILLEEMMARGMITDVDHMSEKATDQALALAEQHGNTVTAEETADWPDEQRAAYLARTGVESDELGNDADTWNLLVKIRDIWRQWNEMSGNNRPLARSTAGPRRDFDINLDGMAHYGMLPDLLQDIRNASLTAEDLLPLFRSANDYVQMWDRCEQAGAEKG